MLEESKRKDLVYIFKINKSQGMEVENNKLVCDGCSQEDLMTLSISEMIEYLGDDWEKVPNEELFDYLFKKVLEKIYGKTKQAGIEDGEVKKTSEPKSNRNTSGTRKRK